MRSSLSLTTNRKVGTDDELQQQQQNLNEYTNKQTKKLNLNLASNS